MKERSKMRKNPRNVEAVHTHTHTHTDIMLAVE